MKKFLEILENIFSISLLIGLFYLAISSSQKIYVTSYNVDTSEPIIIESFNVGRDMSQSITFKDNSGTTQVLGNLVYDGSTNPKVIYIYHIGRYKLSEFIRWDGYYYYATDKYAGESFY